MIVRSPARGDLDAVLALLRAADAAVAVRAQADPGVPPVPTRVLFDNDAIRVQEVTFRRGEQGVNAPRPFRVIRVLQGGTMQRSHPDGTTDRVVYRTGEVIVYQADQPFVPKNIGDTDIVFFVVALKSPKP